MATTTVSTIPTSTPALTTIFTPPSSCLQRTYTLSPSGIDNANLPPDDYLSIWRGFTSDCFPSEATLSDGWVYISPGICPSAYSIASQYTVGQTTMATCCPWYMHVSESYYDCGSFPESTSVELNVGDTAIATAGYAWDTPIVIAWQSKDLSHFPHHPTETGSWNVAKGISSPPTPSTIPPIIVSDEGMFISATSTESSSETSTTTSSAIPTTSSASAGLSTGAKAGIGVGVSAGAIILIGLGVLLFWKRRKAKKEAVSGDRDLDQSHAELPGDHNQPVQIADDGHIHEKSTAENTHEVEGDTLRQELGGDEPDKTKTNTLAELEGDAVAGAEMRRDYSTDVAKS